MSLFPDGSFELLHVAASSAPELGPRVREAAISGLTAARTSIQNASERRKWVSRRVLRTVVTY